MFRKTRLQLALFNAAVFFLLLAVGGTALFMYTHNRLYAEVDEVLAQRAAQQLVQLSRNGAPVNIRPPRHGVEDAPMATLLWDEQGQLIQQFPEESVGTDYLDEFADLLKEREPLTMELAGHSFRVLTVDPIKVAPMKSPYRIEAAAPFAKMQIVRNIDAEQAMLSRLLIGVAAGSLLGLLLAVLAGFFLAGRALVPIRAAWDKQQKFVADASHELRTPLAVVRSHTELLLRHPDRTVLDSSAHISAILKENRRMTTLVNDLLTLARSDSEQLEVRFTQVAHLQ